MSCAVQEILNINVLFTIAKRFLVFLLNGSQMHVVGNLMHLIDTDSVESFILSNFVEWIFFVRAYWNNGASLINLVDSVAESVKFSN